eukprot:141513-Pleurochrysis_carterae.AAC.1
MLRLCHATGCFATTSHTSYEIPDSSKEHMKLYIAGELSKMLSAYADMEAPTARNLLTPQHLVQVNHFTPAGYHSASTPSTSQASTGTGVVGVV